MEEARRKRRGTLTWWVGGLQLVQLLAVNGTEWADRLLAAKRADKMIRKIQQSTINEPGSSPAIRARWDSLRCLLRNPIRCNHCGASADPINHAILHEYHSPHSLAAHTTQCPPTRPQTPKLEVKSNIAPLLSPW